MTLPAEDFDIQEREAGQRPGAFGEYVGYIKEVIRMDGMFRRGLAAHHTLIAITFEAGNFQKGGKVADLLLAFTYRSYRGSSEGPAFFLASDWWQISWGGGRRYTGCAYGGCIGLCGAYDLLYGFLLCVYMPLAVTHSSTNFTFPHMRFFISRTTNLTTVLRGIEGIVGCLVFSYFKMFGHNFLGFK
jgi:hypothetical protein